MKFGKQLESDQLPKYRGRYLQYKELKKALKVWTGVEKDQATVQEVTHWASSFLRMGPNPEISPEMRLNEMLRMEMERINKTAEREEGGIRSQLGRLEEDMRKVQQSPSAAPPEEAWADLVKELDDLAEQVVQLKHFARMNFTGFRKILKKYDKWSPGKKSVTPWFMAEVARSTFMRVGYTSLLAQFNRISKTMRKANAFGKHFQRLTSGGFDSCQHPTHEVVHTLNPHDTMKARILLARHLNIKGVIDTAPERKRSYSIYLDTPDLSVYSAHLGEGHATEEGPGAAAAAPCASVHLRHCGGDTAAVVLEGPGEARREVLLNSAETARLLTGGLPAVGRAPADGGALLSGVSAPVPKDQALTALRAAQELLGQRKQQPMAHASYFRSVFQDDSGIFTVILDEDLRMARAPEPFNGTPSHTEWFPHNILTVHWSAGLERVAHPDWFRTLCDTTSTVQVSGLSKAALVLAHFYAKGGSERLPPWYRELFATGDQEQGSQEGASQDASDPAEAEAEAVEAAEASLLPSPGSTSASYARANSGASRLLHDFQTSPEQEEEAAKQRIEEEPQDTFPQPSAPGGLGAPLLDRPVQEPPLESKPSPKPGFFRRIFGSKAVDDDVKVRDAIVSVQPKTLYSNERTFLEWMHFATILATIGVAMMHGIPSPASVPIGRFIVVVAICVSLRSWYTFNWRADALDGKEIIDYSDKWGPLILMLVLLVALGWSVAHALGVVQVEA